LPSRSPPPPLTLPPPPPPRGTSRACRPPCCHCCAVVGVGVVSATVAVSVAIALACQGQCAIAQYDGSAVSLGEKVHDMQFFLPKKLSLAVILLDLSHRLYNTRFVEPAHALRGLEEPFFQLCCCVSFCFWREIGFGFYILLCTWSTIQLWCCVSFFGSGGK
jgi:hypothetical protein